MKETQIAKVNVEEKLRLERLKVLTPEDCWISSQMKINLHITLSRCSSHKQTCQRWLDEDDWELVFINALEDKMKKKNMLLFGFVVRRKAKVLKKIKDKKQAIKIYEDNGI